MMVVMGEGSSGLSGRTPQPQSSGSGRKVVTLCPTVEELRQKSDVPCSSVLSSVVGRRKLACPVPECGASSFKSQRGLVQHINAMHPHLSPYKKTSSGASEEEEYHFHCPQQNCVYNSVQQYRWFSSLTLLRYHYINTHDEKRYACTKCGRRFGWERDQKNHQRECGQVFACSRCPAYYNSRSSLLTHCYRHNHPLPPQFARQASQKSKPAKGKAKTSAQSAGEGSNVTVSQLSHSPSVPSAFTAIKGSPALSTQTLSSTPLIASFVSSSAATSDVTLTSRNSEISGVCPSAAASNMTLTPSAKVPGFVRNSGVCPVSSSSLFSASPHQSDVISPQSVSLASSGMYPASQPSSSVSTASVVHTTTMTKAVCSHQSSPAVGSGASLSSGTAPDVFLLSFEAGFPTTSIITTSSSDILSVASASIIAASHQGGQQIPTASLSSSLLSSSSSSSSSTLPLLPVSVPVSLISPSTVSSLPVSVPLSLLTLSSRAVCSVACAPSVSVERGGDCAAEHSGTADSSSSPICRATCSSQYRSDPSADNSSTAEHVISSSADASADVTTDTRIRYVVTTSASSPADNRNVVINSADFSANNKHVNAKVVISADISSDDRNVTTSIANSNTIADSRNIVSASAVMSANVTAGMKKTIVTNTSADTATVGNRDTHITVSETTSVNTTTTDNRNIATSTLAHNIDRHQHTSTGAAPTSKTPQRKLRPILPKRPARGGVVFLGPGPQDRGVVLSALPWVDAGIGSSGSGTERDSAGRFAASAGCQTGMGAEEGGVQGVGGVEVSVVHMGTQVGVAPIPHSPNHALCHTGTQVYVAQPQTHAGVQTCALTTHSGTQLAAPLAPLPVHTVNSSSSTLGGADNNNPLVLHVASRPQDEGQRPAMCAVAIQTGSQVEMVNMAIQANSSHQCLPQGAGVVVDMMGLCQEGHPEDNPYATSAALSSSGTHTACQTSFPYILLNSRGNTSTIGTQAAGPPGYILEDTDMTSKGMQTSLTLIQRPRLTVRTDTAAQTQTLTQTQTQTSPLPRGGKLSLLKSVGTSPRAPSRGPPRARKRSTRCCEVQTSQPNSPRCKKGRRRKRKKDDGDGGGDSSAATMHEISIATQTLVEQGVIQLHSEAGTSQYNMEHSLQPESSQQTMEWASQVANQWNQNTTNTRSEESTKQDGTGNDTQKGKSRSKGAQSKSIRGGSSQPQHKNSESDNPQHSPQPHHITTTNPTLSSTASSNLPPPHNWDPFLSPGTPCSPPANPPPCPGLPSRLEDLLSQYRVDLGVQTPDNFESPFSTADAGMQTVRGDEEDDWSLSTTADLAVQTLDIERCTADFGVQTSTTVLGCLLENLDADLASYGGNGGVDLSQDKLHHSSASTSSISLSFNTGQVTGQGSSPSSSSIKHRSATVTSQTCTSQDFDLPLETPLNTGETPKLFDSFDSDLSFSDCGTGTEDFFSSTHTQTASMELTMGDDFLPSLQGLSSTSEEDSGTESQSRLLMNAVASSQGSERSLRESSLERYITGRGSTRESSVDRSMSRPHTRASSVGRIVHGTCSRENSVERSMVRASSRGSSVDSNAGRPHTRAGSVLRNVCQAFSRESSVERNVGTSRMMRGGSTDFDSNRAGQRDGSSVDRDSFIRDGSVDRHIVRDNVREVSTDRDDFIEASLDRHNFREGSIDRQMYRHNFREGSFDRDSFRDGSSVDRQMARDNFRETSVDSNSRASMDLFPACDATAEEDTDIMLDLCPPSPCPSGLGGPTVSRPTSTSTTDTDLLSGVPAMDMTTQTTADHDDLLTLLMTNMETQTQDDLFLHPGPSAAVGVADSHTQTSTSPPHHHHQDHDALLDLLQPQPTLGVADSHTQTSSLYDHDVLLTPPHHLESYLDQHHPGSSSSAAVMGQSLVVSAETQTTGQSLWDFQDPDHDEWFDLADTETQTMLM